MIKHKLLEKYSPLYFLAALGAGGVAITFFIHLTFAVDHPQSPIVTFDQLWPILRHGSPWAGALTGLAMAGLLAFSLLHLRLLAWNLIEFLRFRRTDSYPQLLRSNNEVSLMTIPLTLAMTINVMFVNGAVFVPGLWQHVDRLFPFAIAAFLAVGTLALRLYARYFARLISAGEFDFGDNNNLGQMVAVFAFAMVSVGLAAPGAISHQVEINALGVFGAVFFAAVAMTLGLLKLVLGFKSMLRYGITSVASPSLWILIPILTLLGIAMIRVGFDQAVSTPGLFLLTSGIFSLQILFGILGYTVMLRLNYFGDYLHGEQRHPDSYALVCPGVAFFVFGMFFISFGLLQNGLIEKFSIGYFAALAPLVYIQAKTIKTMLRLNDRLLREPSLVAT